MFLPRDPVIVTNLSPTTVITLVVRWQLVPSSFLEQILIFQLADNLQDVNVGQNYAKSELQWPYDLGETVTAHFIGVKGVVYNVSMINITNLLDQKWDYGNTWGVQYYETGTDGGGA